jgi:hypothetical protein
VQGRGSSSASGCDPQPLSTFDVDACGVCGGDNSTCRATIELLVAQPNAASLATGRPAIFLQAALFP